ncbi:hypothetical protein GE09DRAFT_501728 [Coniochaeta sp. 2T2.1]|nr:hypothetical protein GE09DRAFT_501728 [Coniochaeta sp. 2T2.1]
MRALSSLLAVALGILTLVHAQDIPFSFNGAFNDASASSADANSGGSVTVNGYTITVPKNMQVAFPAAFIGWRDFVDHKGSFIGYQMDVIGNIVSGTPLAAQISIAQFELTAGTGYIDSVNDDGRIVLRGGPTLRINDPNAVYSVGYTGQPFFTADDANPSITSFSGFPMCVPRNASDPLCPQSNRPVIAGGSKQGAVRAPDPLVMAPLTSGDYVEYSAFVAGNGEHIVYNLVATNIQLTTSGVPTYIRMEDAIIGVWTSNQNTQEVAQTRFIGMTSDNAVSGLKIYAIDIDPCTGETTDREIGGAPLIDGAARNKFEYRAKPVQASTYTREYRIVAGTGTKLTKNGILAGQYVMPVSEWIQPEATTPGLAPFANDFSGFSHLTKGLGYDDDGVLWGPLSPFPQSGVSVFSGACAPKAVSSSSSSVASATATGLAESESASATPTTSSVPTTLSTSTTSSSTPATSSAAPPAVNKDLVTMPVLTWISSQSGTLTVRCISNSTDNAKVNMKLSYSNRGGQTSGLTMTAGGQGTWDFSSSKIKEPTQVTCLSGLGGSVTVNR